MSRVFLDQIKKKNLALNVDFLLSDFKNFQVTAFALHSMIQTAQSIRIIMVATLAMKFVHLHLFIFLWAILRL
jgi:hypothetical protein